MTDHRSADIGDDELAAQLADLGGALALDVDLSAELRGQLLASIRTPLPRRRHRRLIAIAAAVVALTVAAAMMVPSSRRTVARWFGLDGVEVDVDPEAVHPPDPAPAPPGSRTYQVDGGEVSGDGGEVTVTRLGGRFDDVTITKTVAAANDVREVTIAGRPGLWFPTPHTVLYVDARDQVVGEGVAGSTLLVDTGDGILRLEGFEDLDDAAAFVEQLCRDGC